VDKTTGTDAAAREGEREEGGCARVSVNERERERGNERRESERKRVHLLCE